MRSKLFVPAIRPELFPKALASEADAISFDLEDAVPAERKAEARALLKTSLASSAFLTSPKKIIVRVNAISSEHFVADVNAVVGGRIDLLNVPKIESAQDILIVTQLLHRLEDERGVTLPIGILANIESPRGLRRAAKIAQADPRVIGLQLGFGDLFEPLGIDRQNPATIAHVQLLLRLAAGEANIWAYDAAYPHFKDAEGFRREAAAAKSLGFIGKTCIHPSQITLANEIFRPSAADLDFAQRVVTAAATAQLQGLGAFTVEGKMIDEPFLQRARAIIASTTPPNSPASSL